MSRDITKAVPLLQEFWPFLKARYAELNPGAELFITHVDRTAVEQLLLFVQGRLPQFPGSIVTWKDGFVCKSKHNVDATKPLSDAFDVGTKIHGVVTWNPSYILKIGAILENSKYKGKIKWGGVFGDNYHFEVI